MGFHAVGSTRQDFSIYVSIITIRLIYSTNWYTQNFKSKFKIRS